MAAGDLRGTLSGAANSITNPFAITTGGPIAVSVGDILYAVCAEQATNTVTACGDNLHGASTWAATSAAADAGTTVTGRAFWKRVTTAGSLSSVSFVATGSGNNVAAVCAVIEGPHISSPLDANPANTTNDNTSPYAGPATGTLAQAAESVLCWIVHNASVTLTATSPNLKAVQQATQAILTVSIGYQRVNATTTVTPEWTASAVPTQSAYGTTSFMIDTSTPQVATLDKLPVPRVLRGSAMLSQSLGRSPLYGPPAEEEVFILPAPVEYIYCPKSSVAAITAQPLGRIKGLLPEPEEPPDITVGAPVEQWIAVRSRLASIVAQLLGSHIPPVVGLPFKQLDWPNPQSAGRVQDWIGHFNVTLRAEARPFGPFEWTVPKGPAYAVTLRTWVDPTKQQLIGQDQLPNRWREFPNPRGRDRAVSLLTWVETTVPLPDSAPFKNFNWPNPQVPRQGQAWVSQFNNALRGEEARPFALFDWPNPRGPQAAIQLRTWIDLFKTNLDGQDQFFGLAGHPNFDWPNPRGPSWRPQDWRQGFRVQDQAAQFPPTNTNFDWPVPKGREYAVTLRTWIDPTRRQLIGQDQLPNRQLDWPNPRGALRRPQGWSFVRTEEPVKPPPRFDWQNPRRAQPTITLSTWIDNTRILLIGQDQLPNRQTEWPNPRGASRRPQAWIDMALAATVQPVRQLDWPNPRGVVAHTSLKTWVDQTRIQLIGQDQFFGVAGNPTHDWPNPRGPSRRPQDWRKGPGALEVATLVPAEGLNFDWPNPRGATYPISLRTWVDRTKIQLIGQDKFFGLAGHPSYDWPVPKGQKGVVTLYTWAHSISVTLRPVVSPFPTPEWTNPRGPLSIAYRIEYGSGTLDPHKTLSPDLFIDPDVFFDPAIEGGEAVIVPDLLVDADTFFPPIVGQGVDVNITPDLFADTDSFFIPSIIREPGYDYPIGRRLDSDYGIRASKKGRVRLIIGRGGK